MSATNLMSSRFVLIVYNIIDNPIGNKNDGAITSKKANFITT